MESKALNTTHLQREAGGKPIVGNRLDSDIPQIKCIFVYETEITDCHYNFLLCV